MIEQHSAVSSCIISLHPNISFPLSVLSGKYRWFAWWGTRGEKENKLSFLSVGPAHLLLPSSQPEPKARFEQVSAGTWRQTDKDGLKCHRLIFHNDGVPRFWQQPFFQSSFVPPNRSIVDFVWETCTTHCLPCLGAEVCWSAGRAPLSKAGCAGRGAAHHTQLHPSASYEQGNITVGAAHLQVCQVLVAP